MRTIKISVTDENGVVLGREEIEVEDNEVNIAVVPLARGRELLQAAATLKIGDFAQETSHA